MPGYLSMANVLENIVQYVPIKSIMFHFADVLKTINTADRKYNANIS
jgi:hypothetical protein